MPSRLADGDLVSGRMKIVGPPQLQVVGVFEGAKPAKVSKIGSTASNRGREGDVTTIQDLDGGIKAGTIVPGRWNKEVRRNAVLNETVRSQKFLAWAASEKFAAGRGYEEH